MIFIDKRLDKQAILQKALDECSTWNSGYQHLDYPISKQQRVKIVNKIFENKENYVVHFPHLPFVTYHIYYDKYFRSEGKLRLKKKVRTISLPSHRDWLLLKCYSLMLSESYENYLVNQNLVKEPVAYRKNMDNIDAAKEVFDFISIHDNVEIIKGDFSHFFDRLIFRYAKDKVAKVLGVDRLADDWFAVLKFMFKHSFLYRKELLKISSNKRVYENRFDKLRKNRRPIFHKVSGVGIPQGTSLSAVLANVYMIDFDLKMKLLAENVGGIYRRYSDDFIVAFPSDRPLSSEATNIINKIMHLSCEAGQELNSDKIQHLYYFDKKVIETKNGKVSQLNYLGFSFDGRIVTLRPGSAYRYVWRSKKNIHMMTRVQKNRKYFEQGGVPHTHELTENKRQNWFIMNVDQAQRQDYGDYKLKKNYTKRRKIVNNYLSINEQSMRKSTMLSYAVRAQSKMEIFEHDVLYSVKISSVIKKIIKKNRLEVNKIRKEKNNWI